MTHFLVKQLLANHQFIKLDTYILLQTRKKNRVTLQTLKQVVISRILQKDTYIVPVFKKMTSKKFVKTLRAHFQVIVFSRIFRKIRL